MTDTISINTGKIEKGFGQAKSFLKQKKVMNIIVIVLLLVLLIGGAWIRLQNLPLLKDSTTGEYIPVALDPFYFLRIAETMVDQGSLPEYDSFRQPHDIPYTNEILPNVVVFMYNIAKVFDSDVSLQFIHIIYPVVLFVLGLVAFFFLVYFLTNSKFAALVSSIFLTVLPTYLYRTTAGFSDHEAIGMFAFFLTLLGYTLALKFLYKEENRKNLTLKVILFGALVGFLSALTIASWGGVANFLFMIIPLSFGLFWLIKTQSLSEKSEKNFLNYVVFYIIWFVSTIVFTLFYGYTLQESLGRVTLSATSILTGAFLFFIVVDFIFIWKKNLLVKEKSRKYRVLYSAAVTFVLGIIFVILFFGGTSYITDNVINRLLHPFGTERVSLTVAENAQPFLNDWINQTGKIFFWLFFGGLMTLGISIGRSMKKNKDKILFGFLWVLFMFGILFSRVSPDSLFNGTNFISRLFYFGSALLFFGYFIRLYFKERIEIKPELLIIFSWALFMLIAARGAIRTFFLITPFACFSVGLLFINLSNYIKKNKDDLLKMILWILIIVVVIASLFSFNNLLNQTIVQAKNTGPSANLQWQQAMDWVRENTPENSIFLHWWDYGYWVQYLGERPTLADGGHFEGAFRDHLIGRYILTTPQPETALSFMKTNNVSYLLIDPTDIGKYPAYSTIGSDETGNDRRAQLNIMLLDASQTRETNTSEIRIYQGGAFVDQDIIYNLDGQDILLPRQRAIIAGFVLELIEKGDSITFNQPEAIFIYNNQQIRIPVRYLYFNNQIIDFGEGLEAGFFMIPFVSSVNNQNVQVSEFGSAIYLSPKVFPSLVAQLYLMDDPFDRYETLELAHSEQDPFVSLLKTQSSQIGDFVFFNGLRGPIKIWDTTSIPDNILVKEEFLRTSGEYAEFDDLQFTK